MRKIAESLFSQFPQTSNPDDLELYDLVAFQNPKGNIVITRFFSYSDGLVTFHNLKYPAKEITKYYILGSPLRMKFLDRRRKNGRS